MISCKVTEERISTHDLARRSTSNGTVTVTIQQHFNSRPRKEVDICYSRSFLSCSISTHDLARRSTQRKKLKYVLSAFQLTTSQGGRQQFLRKKFSFQNHFLCSLHIIYSYYINIVFFSTLFLAKSSFFLVRIPQDFSVYLPFALSFLPAFYFDSSNH